MRIVHTSDWHIGRRFKGVDLTDYQSRAFDWLLALIEREQVDVLCVSGDIYDTARPSSQHVDLFSSVINRLARLRVNGKPVEVIITPGNHDSALRVGSFDEALVPNIHMCARIERILEPIEVKGSSDHQHDEVLLVYALPYLHPDVARQPLAQMLRERLESGELALDDLPEGIYTSETGEVLIDRSHEAVFRAVLTLLLPDIARRRERAAAQGLHCSVVLMAHAFVSGATRTEGEYPITVGGVDNVPADLFAESGIDYLALGHLHRPQAVAIPQEPSAQLTSIRRLRDRSISTQSEAQYIPQLLEQCRITPIARYSGSLLAYSFGEAGTVPVLGNHKSIVLAQTQSIQLNQVQHSEKTSQSQQSLSQQHQQTEQINEAEQSVKTKGAPTTPAAKPRFTIIDTPPVQSDEPAFAIVEGNEQEVLAQAAQHAEHWVSARVHYTEYPVGLYNRLDYAYAHVLEKMIINDVPKRELSAMPARQDMRGQELQIMKQFVLDMTGREADAEEIQVLQQALDDVLHQQ